MSTSLVHIVDDDPAIRDSLRMLVESADMAARVYPDAETFLAMADLIDPGCVVADVRMPGMSGIDLLRAMRGRGIAIPLIVISGHADVAMAVEALKEGASDFLEKPFDDNAFLRSIHEALECGRRTITQRRLRAEIEARAQTLTPREWEVMARVVSGMPNKVVAADLGISVRTVEIHRARVMEKMEAESLSGLVRMALELEGSGSAPTL